MMERYKLEIVNDQGESYIRGEPAPDGSWVMFKDVAALEARADRNAAGYARVDADARRAEFLHKQKIAVLQRRVAELEAALVTARRDALTEIKQDTDKLIEQGRKDGMEYAAQIADNYANRNHVSLNIGVAIRAALAGGKKDE